MYSKCQPHIAEGWGAVNLPFFYFAAKNFLAFHNGYSTVLLL